MKALADEIRIVRQESGLSIWRTPLGKLATADTEIKDHIAFLVAEFQRNVYLSGPIQVGPSALVLDVGANIGLFTQQAIRAGARLVICVEPNPASVRALRWNLAPEIASNRVSIITKGAWHAVDRLPFLVDPKRPGRSSCVVAPPEEAVYEISIEVAPLDLMVRELELPRVEFIKIDIEGAELSALQGASEILHRYKPQLAIAVEHTADRITNARKVRALVRKLNPRYHCDPGPYVATNTGKPAPDVLYFY